VKKLERRADNSEDCAADAIWWAAYAIEEAEYATLDAIDARLEADAVAAPEAVAAQ